MTEAPAPPVLAGLDVRCFPTMPLDVARLRNSETWILSTPAERSAAINLWTAAWHAVPAGSLPNDDRVLAHHSMAGADWPNVRPMALRGWVLCSDGRLYHSVVCQFAVEADSQKREATKSRDKKREAMREWRRSQPRGDHVATTEAERADRLEEIRGDVTGREGKEDDAAGASSAPEHPSEILHPEKEPDPKAAAFSEAARWIAKSDSIANPTARGFLGQMVKAAGGGPKATAAVLSAVLDAQAANPVGSVRGMIGGILKKRLSNGKQSSFDRGLDFASAIDEVAGEAEARLRGAKAAFDA